ncbi:MAG: type II toxin-antitoxin system VapC family toxin [Pseudomonadota bacterium]
MILLDTHALVWSLMQPDLLSSTAHAAISGATGWAVSSASLYEIRYKHGIGKWPEIAAFAVDGLPGRLEDLGFEIAPANGPVMEIAGGMTWQHRDPFDRIIVSTALSRALPLVSKDATLDTAPVGDLVRIW